MLPNELIKEFIGKVCYISAFDSFAEYFRILAVEDNWLKVKGSDGVSIINGDMVQEIKLAPEKHQNKYQ